LRQLSATNQQTRRTDAKHAARTNEDHDCVPNVFGSVTGHADPRDAAIAKGLSLEAHSEQHRQATRTTWCWLVSPANPYKTDGGGAPTCAYAVLPIVTVVPVPMIMMMVVVVMIVMVMIVVIVMGVMFMMFMITIMTMIVPMMIMFPGKRCYWK
jgi:hypothetical protein